jgi:probable HAF family extracellular repeat protein
MPLERLLYFDPQIREGGAKMKSSFYRIIFLAILLSIIIGWLPTFAIAKEYTYSTFDYPTADITVPNGINDAGQIVGWYFDSDPNNWAYHGFLLSNGSFTSIDYPTAIGWTYAYGINNSGQIVGQYYEQNYGISHGFLLSGGNFTSFDYPNATLTLAYGINDAGQIVGQNHEPGFYHGFLLSDGNFTTIDYPTNAENRNTLAFGINNAGQIVGYFTDANGYHGFLLSDNTFTSFDLPTAPGTTNAFGINNSGQIVGTFTDANGYHGFLLSSGNFTSFDYPNAIGTLAFGINNSGQIVGYYYDANGSHAFIATPVPEPITIDIKPGSYPNSINPNSKGKIPVAILSTEDLDAPNQIVPNSLTFGATGGEVSLAFCNPKGDDVNGDGLKDLVCHFYTQKTGFQCGDTEGILKGQTLDGTLFEGSDSVRIVPCK